MTRKTTHWTLEVIGILGLLVVLICIVKLLTVLNKTHAHAIDPIMYKYIGITPEIPWNEIYRRAKVKQLKGESICRRYLERRFGRPFPKIKPNWLKSPKTNRNLELDCYNSQLRIALEYDGIQHRMFTPYFHKKPSDFTEQLWRDQFKNHQCQLHGICLIRVPDTVAYAHIEEFIERELCSRNM